MNIRKIDAGVYVVETHMNLSAIVDLLGVGELSDEEFKAYLGQLRTTELGKES